MFRCSCGYQAIVSADKPGDTFNLYCSIEGVNMVVHRSFACPLNTFKIVQIKTKED